MESDSGRRVASFLHERCHLIHNIVVVVVNVVVVVGVFIY